MTPAQTFALSHPVYDPTRDILPGHGRMLNARASMLLTVNIGQE